jgi:hypothetical protein
MHPKVLSNDAWRLVKALDGEKLLEGWTLAGGTGLALQWGHRFSEDLDLFRTDGFDPDILLNKLSSIGPIEVQDRSQDTLHALIAGIRFSFLRIQPPLLFTGHVYRGITIADPRDIAVMKIVAAGGRGSRKDFIDLYFFLKNISGFDEVFFLLGKRFKGIDYNEHHLLKSLVYFKDAETEPMPTMIKKASWKEIKKAVIAEVQRLSG